MKRGAKDEFLEMIIDTFFVLFFVVFCCCFFKTEKRTLRWLAPNMNVEKFSQSELAK